MQHRAPYQKDAAVCACVREGRGDRYADGARVGPGAGHYRSEIAITFGAVIADTHQAVAGGDFKAFPGYANRSFLHVHSRGAKDRAEIMVHRGTSWLVASVQNDYPNGRHLPARAGRRSRRARR